ncbi:hypothetical protein [Nakamurella leprariae]|uniref:Septum formation-related domain-containing protein n=1 Tax=Nakamurella leprariae TaxID=2803911 RepID=A0A939BZR0_9ACTN|nr:hypothetical protein [Nakamurella leprariae]MBM9468430.1 hypothetical protein [Nakamurella leprariae]
MDRRWLGAVMLAMALLAVVVVSVIDDRIVGGRPVAEPLVPAPRTGDCVIGFLDQATSYGSPLYLPSPAVRACDGPRQGEVVFVVPDYVASVVAPDRDFRQPTLAESCRDQAGTYLGLDPVPEPHAGAPSTVPNGMWSATAGFGSALIGPGPRQAAAGQAWGACIVYPIDLAGDPAGALAGPVAGVLHLTTPDTARFGVCREQVGGAAVGCTRPHRAELFGFTTVTPDVEPSQLESSCRDLVTTATDMPDPTAAGRLRITVTVRSHNGSASDDPLGTVAQCAIELTDPVHSLTSSLWALGSTALPVG